MSTYTRRVGKAKRAHAFPAGGIRVGTARSAPLPTLRIDREERS
jgi:hypothetical protein